jgi:hypothetical protein
MFQLSYSGLSGCSDVLRLGTPEFLGAGAPRFLSWWWLLNIQKAVGRLVELEAERRASRFRLVDELLLAMQVAEVGSERACYHEGATQSHE